MIVLQMLNSWFKKSPYLWQPKHKGCGGKLKPVDKKWLKLSRTECKSVTDARNARKRAKKKDTK